VATTVHIPDRLLERVDARARALGVSRNRLVVEALEEKLAPHAAWPPELVELLSTPVDAEVAAAARQMEAAMVRARRSRKRRLRL
jgi:predicted transcriptional regulator